MKKNILILLLFFTATLFGQDVSESLAVDVANHYYERVKNDNLTENISRIKATNQVRGGRIPELISPLGLAEMWLVPVEDGWVLVSTNTKATPILAHYQTTEKPVYDSMTSGEKYLLEWYESEIAYANDSCPNCQQNWKWNLLLQDKLHGINHMRSIPVVPPLTHTKWMQTGNNEDYIPSNCDKSYNKFCPAVNNAPSQCNKAAAGCTAVAIAQIMAYWRWPYAANVQTTSGGDTTELKFYDWSIMPTALYNTSYNNEVDMVTELLRDCGYMAATTYGIKSSSSISKAKDALIAFGYNESTIDIKKKWLTSGWQTMLQNEINANRPVYYRGTKNAFGADGHAFVVDGYDSDGYFHLNIGGSSIYNTYYNIDTIIVNGHNFNHWQEAIIGIQPAPYCGSAVIDETVIFPSRFSITAGGELVFEEKVLQNIERGEIFSATQVRLTNGFTIREGCNVRIAIMDVPCPSTTYSIPEIQAAPAKRNGISDSDLNTPVTFSISPNPVNAILHLQTDEELSQVNIYNLNGQCVLQADQTDIDVSALPQGMYILRACAVDGAALSAKFIKN